MDTFFLTALDVEEEELYAIIGTSDEDVMDPQQITTTGGEIHVVLGNSFVLLRGEIAEVSLFLLFVAVTTVGQSALVGARQTRAHDMATASTDCELFAGTVFPMGRKASGSKEVATTSGAGYELVRMSPLLLGGQVLQALVLTVVDAFSPPARTTLVRTFVDFCVVVASLTDGTVVATVEETR